MPSIFDVSTESAKIEDWLAERGDWKTPLKKSPVRKGRLNRPLLASRRIGIYC
jgi:hypothetical protein